jgi:hypothetical protein
MVLPAAKVGCRSSGAQLRTKALPSPAMAMDPLRCGSCSMSVAECMSKQVYSMARLLPSRNRSLFRLNLAEFKRLDLVLEPEFLTLFRSLRRVGLQLSIVRLRRCAVGKGKSMSVCVAWGTHSEMDSHEVDGLHARRAQVESGRAHLFGRRVRATARSGALASHFGFGGHGRSPMCFGMSSCILGEGVLAVQLVNSRAQPGWSANVATWPCSCMDPVRLRGMWPNRKGRFCLSPRGHLSVLSPSFS